MLFELLSNLSGPIILGAFLLFCLTVLFCLATRDKRGA